MENNKFLLNRYFKQGWLSRCYFDGQNYHQPYSDEDRLLAGECFYADFLKWNACGLKSRDYTSPLVDGGVAFYGVSLSPEAERFRRALRRLSKDSFIVVYKIVLEEKEICAPRAMSARERLYFNDEIKGLLCRGLDQLASYYQKIL